MKGRKDASVAGASMPNPKESQSNFSPGVGPQTVASFYLKDLVIGFIQSGMISHRGHRARREGKGKASL
jgi:hypothetical protein